MLQSAPEPQLTLQLASQRTLHVPPLLQETLPLAPTVTSQVAVEAQEMLHDSPQLPSQWLSASQLSEQLDGPMATLIDDLKERGLLETTLVIWMGEFGRTPGHGKNHYAKAWTVVLSGGGVKGGIVHGATDEDGRHVKEKPVTSADLFATIYTTLGMNPRVKHVVGTRPIWAGIGAYRLTPAQTIENILTARRLGAAGVVLFSYDSLIDARVSAPDYLALVGRGAFAPVTSDAGSR